MSGNAVVTQAGPVTVDPGTCMHVTEVGAPAPCATVTPRAAVRVTVEGSPVLLVASPWLNNAVPTKHAPAPLTLVPAQTRVTAQ